MNAASVFRDTLFLCHLLSLLNGKGEGTQWQAIKGVIQFSFLYLPCGRHDSACRLMVNELLLSPGTLISFMYILL